MADVWERLTKQAGKKFSIRNDTALKAAQAVAVTERGFMTIEGNCEALSFPAVGFGTLPGRNGERLGQVFVERKDALSDVLKEHLATLRHMRQMYMVTAKLIGSAEEETANAFRRLGIDPSAEYQLRFESNAQTAVADVFDKGRNSRDGHKNNKLLPEFVPGNASVQYRKSGVESWPADAMTWHDLWDLGRSVKPDPIRAAGEYWISFAYEIENLLVDLNKALDKAFTDWEGESQKAATAAHDRFQTEMAALHKGMFATGVELAFAAGWLASTPYGMPTESTPVYNGDDADDTTGHVRGEGYWDFLTSLTGIREYYKNSYLDGFKISRDRIPKFTPPKTTPKNDLKKEAERKKREEAERKKTVEYPRQKLNADQQQLTPQQIKDRQSGSTEVQRIDKGSKTIQQGVQDVNNGAKMIRQGIALSDTGTALVQQGQTDLARGRELIRQRRTEAGNALVRKGKQEIAQGEVEIKKGKELIKQGEKEVRAGQEKIKEGHNQIKDAEKALRDADKQDTGATQAIKQADQCQKTASQANAVGEQYAKAGQAAITESNKWLPGGQNSTEPAPPQPGTGETGGQQPADQQGIVSPGQQQGAGSPGQQQSGAQDGMAALAGIAMAAGAFAQTAGQGVQAIIQAGVAAASQMEHLGTPVPGSLPDDQRPVDPDDAHEPENSDEPKAPKQRYDNGGSTPPSLPEPEPMPDRQTNLFPQSGDPPVPLPPAPVIEPLVLPSQKDLPSAAPHEGGSAEAESNSVQSGVSFGYSAGSVDVPVGDVSGVYRPVVDR
ncbi:hypothetical protein ACLMAJ_17770 [Nocardia sp. KC 131]|uniref:hypothetical protein n=1 Tax=Nocardia arseniciresistens TaxID=3392119 RepID=UPI00398E9E05